MINQVQANRLDAARRTGNRLLGGKPLFDSGPFVLGVVGKYTIEHLIDGLSDDL